jgi:hypothetical protein
MKTRHARTSSGSRGFSPQNQTYNMHIPVPHRWFPEPDHQTAQKEGRPDGWEEITSNRALLFITQVDVLSLSQAGRYTAGTPEERAASCCISHPAQRKTLNAKLLPEIGSDIRQLHSLNLESPFGLDDYLIGREGKKREPLQGPATSGLGSVE